jgi:hypothetical protein
MENFPLSNRPNGVHIEGFPDAKRSVALKGKFARQLAAMALHKVDLERAISYLEEINKTEVAIVREALWRGAVTDFIKCFMSSASRNALDPKAILGTDKEAASHFAFFKNLRNKHIAHDENDYSRCVTCAGINDGTKAFKVEKIFALPIVFIALDQANYNNLHLLIRTTLKWVTNKFDQLCALITAELEEKDIGELLKMPTPNYKFEGPNQSGTNRT